MGTVIQSEQQIDLNDIRCDIQRNRALGIKEAHATA